jgi:HAD superfamily hydrolase (TIGR01509 family)
MDLAYSDHLPVIPGATEAVRRLAEEWPLGLASSSNRPLIDRALAEAELRDQFQATVSSEEVDRGKPHPDVFQAIAKQLEVDPERAVAIEDSYNGVKSAHAAGMAVVLFPNAAFPPGDEAIALASAVLRDLCELTVELIGNLDIE